MHVPCTCLDDVGARGAGRRVALVAEAAQGLSDEHRALERLSHDLRRKEAARAPPRTAPCSLQPHAASLQAYAPQPATPRTAACSPTHRSLQPHAPQPACQPTRRQHPQHLRRVEESLEERTVLAECGAAFDARRAQPPPRRRHQLGATGNVAAARRERATGVFDELSKARLTRVSTE